MSQTEWDELCAATASAMGDRIQQFMTPISRILHEAEGRLEGTGSYLALGNEAYLLTNEHVAAAIRETRLGHMFYGDESVYEVRSHFASISEPIDAAIARVHLTASAAAVPLSFYADRHEPAMGELLYIAGYTGERSGFIFETLISPLTSYLAQEAITQSDALGAYHFAIPWLPGRARKADFRTPDLSLPPGMSGSLVWNTRRVELALRGQSWSPEDARVTGLVRSWSDCSTWVYATRVEHLRAAFPALTQALE